MQWLISSVSVNSKWMFAKWKQSHCLYDILNTRHTVWPIVYWGRSACKTGVHTHTRFVLSDDDWLHSIFRISWTPFIFPYLFFWNQLIVRRVDYVLNSFNECRSSNGLECIVLWTNVNKPFIAMLLNNWKSCRNSD